MRAIAGLLAERGRDAFGFLHLTFQEYFTGRALARLKPDQRWAILRPHLHKPRWREPVPLCAGQLGVIEQRNDQATEFVERILDAESEHEAILHRDLFLACSSMADDVGLSSGLLKTLFESVSKLRTSNVLTIQNSSLTALTHLARIGQEDALRLLIQELDKSERYQPILRNVKPQLDEKSLKPLRQAITAKLNDNKWQVRQAAVNALAGLVASESEVRQTITAKLNDDEWQVRQAAVNALAGLVASESEVRQTITAKLNDDSSGVRQAAVNALAGLVASESEVRQAITAKLNDDDYDVRQAAVNALARLVASESEVRQAITAKLNDDSSGVRQAAVNALAGLVASESEVRQAITAKLNDDNDPLGQVRQAAVNALAGLVASESEVRQTITAKLNDDEWRVRQAAVNALAGLVASESEVRQTITAKLNDDLWPVQQAAVNALTGLVASKSEVRQAITAKLNDDDWRVRQAAVNALTGLVARESDVRQAITAKLNDNDWRVRQAALKALWPHDSDQTNIERSLLWFGIVIEHNPRQADELRTWLVEWLVPFVDNDRQLLDRVIALLDEPAWPLRCGAAQTLVALPGGPPPAVMPKLVGLLTDARGEESWINRVGVAQIFINQKDEELSEQAIEVCLRALDYATEPWVYLPGFGGQVRRQAAIALGQLDPIYHDPKIFARLTRLMQADKDAQVRDTAYSALMRLAAAPEEKHSNIGP
ncbi:HEAT repeat domain-containing protein [Chloroflexi bacterium TSY]|nr:HEAT repeat domain-containing protein [Chloroflexi bacterium TSY]